MPKLDDPRYKTKEVKGFKRKPLRPWDDAEAFITPPSPPLSAPKAEKTPTEVGNNKGTIRGQLGNTTGEQLDNNKGTIREQLGDTKGTISEPLGNNWGSIGEQLREQLGNNIREQLGDELGNNKGTKTPKIIVTNPTIKRLHGLERKLFFCIIKNCRDRSVLQTAPLSNEMLRARLQSSADVVKTVSKRLVKKGVITREPGKRGKGGYMVFTVTEDIKNAALEELAFGEQLGDELGNNKGTELGNNRGTFFSSSSYIKTTTTELPEQWLEINTEPLQKIGFGETQLRQLFEAEADPQIVQESIYQFAFDHERKPIDNALTQLMGTLRKKGLWTARGYESPRDKALRELLEHEKERKAKREAIISELIEAGFTEWLEGLTEEDKKAIAGPHIHLKAPMMAALRQHYRETIVLPKIKKLTGENKHES